MENIAFTMITRGFGWNLIRQLFAWLDSVAYTLFSWIMQLIFDIVAVTSDPAFNSFYDQIHTRIYAILAIFMLFKITVSMLTYLINPDSINDKERGMGKMASRVIVSLVMLIAFPTAFTFLNKIQPHILSAIPRVVLGTDIGPAEMSDQMELSGKKMAFDTYNGVWFNNLCADMGKLSSDGTTDKCFAYGNTVDIAVDHINDPADGNSSEYKYNYFPLAGFITATVMTVILLGFCVDVAIRVFKLIILQIIAPIPIISYIDPKSSKDGAFSKWLKMVTSVYLDLFIKLAVIYFVLLVISSLITSGTIIKVAASVLGDDGVTRAGLVLVAMIIGLLFFAKEAPKFITDALGIKMSENGKLFSGLGKIAAAGALGAGAIGSGLAAGKASYRSDEALGKSHNAGRLMKNAATGILGGVSGLKTGYTAATGAKDHYAKATMDAMAKRNAKTLAAGESGSTALGRLLSTGTGLFSGETSASHIERQIKDLEDFGKSLDAVGSRAQGEMVKQTWTKGLLAKDMYDMHNQKVDEVNYKSFMASYEAAKSAGAATVKFQNAAGQSREITMEAAEFNKGYLLKTNEDDYIKRGSEAVPGSNFTGDESLASLITDAEKKSPTAGFRVTDRNAVKDTREAVNREITYKKRQNATNKANDNFSSTGQ